VAPVERRSRSAAVRAAGRGCYTTQAVATPPEPGTTVLLASPIAVAFQLGDSLGPSASRIEGVVQAQSRQRRHMAGLVG